MKKLNVHIEFDKGLVFRDQFPKYNKASAPCLQSSVHSLYTQLIAFPLLGTSK